MYYLGYANFGPIEVIGLDDVKTQYETNVFGVINVTQAFLSLLRTGSSAERTSRIVNISSGVGRITMPNNAVYGSTKYSIEALTDGLRTELKKFQIDVIAVQPG